MSQIERGGMNVGRWPADVANVADDEGAAVDEVAGGDQDRLAGLPAYEQDADTSVGAGLTTSGGSAEDRGVEDMGGEGVGSELGDDRLEDTGLPLGKS